MKTLTRRPTAAQLLSACGYTGLHQAVAVDAADEVVLVGVVRTYFLKQMAQEVVRPALAGRRLRNRLIVIPDERP